MSTTSPELCKHREWTVVRMSGRMSGVRDAPEQVRLQSRGCFPGKRARRCRTGCYRSSVLLVRPNREGEGQPSTSANSGCERLETPAVQYVYKWTLHRTCGKDARTEVCLSARAWGQDREACLSAQAWGQDREVCLSAQAWRQDRTARSRGGRLES